MRPIGCIAGEARALVALGTDEAIDHRGLDRRGRDRIHADALLRELERRRLGEALDRVLGCDVDARASEAEMAGDAARY
jgi:hypothetical protein